jgi:hypothetical protein
MHLGADVNLRMTDGTTALNIALAKIKSAIGMDAILLKNGAKITELNQKNSKKLLDLLRESGKDLGTKNILSLAIRN